MATHVYVPGRTEAFHRVEGQWVRDVILGANDGLVSIMALVAGVAGAARGRTVLIAGLVGVIAGAISMGLGAFVAARSYRAFYAKELERERWEVAHMPEVEREEIRKIYRTKGLAGDELEMVVGRITSDPEIWIGVMMQEELGLSESFGRPLRSGLIMFVAFVAGGIFPVLPFFLSSGTAALVSSILVTAVALAAAGVVRSRYTGERPLRSGLELVAMAAAGVGAAHGLGRLFGHLA